MGDKLRVCKITNVNIPDGVSITFQGNEVGRSMGNGEIVIYNEVVYRMIRNNEARFSLEVTRK